MLCLKSSSAVPVQRAGDRVCRHQMPFDYKYKWAVDGFSHGIKQPVPLAEVEAHREPNGYFYIGFINGVTRTHWLLAILSSFPDWGLWQGKHRLVTSSRWPWHKPLSL